MDDEAPILLTKIRNLLPSGFYCHDAHIYSHHETFEPWFTIQFDYCDRHKYLCCKLPCDAQDIADQIEITPVLHDCPEIGHYAAVVRCLRKNPAYS